MSARIFDLSEMAALRLQTCESATASHQANPGIDSVSFWTGASGRRYVHSVFDAVSCPELPAANYVLVRRGRGGEPAVLKVGVVEHYAPALNRAELRHRAARLGAGEIHLHLLADRPSARAAVRIDLAAGLMPEAARTAR
ncbi:MAG: hypothetical protein R3D27_13750 [Hyphomicrobiaceae bacterium]